MSRIFFILFVFTALAFSQESLPPYHWANDYLNYLIVRQKLPELNRSQRPFDRGEIAKGLLNLEDHTPLTPEEKKMIRLLLREFKPEIKMLAAREGQKWRDLAKKILHLIDAEATTRAGGARLKAGLLLRSAGEKDLSDSFGDIRFNPSLVMNFSGNFNAVWNFMVLSHADSNYIGKKFSGLYAYNQQAYVQYDNDWLRIKLGRDWLQLGPGRSGQLLFSDNSRTFDQYYLQIGKSALQLHFWGIMLDRRRNTDPLQIAKNKYSNRFINGHRLEYIFNKRYRFGLNEVILYGGPNVNWEMPYMNPLLSYHAYLLNHNGRDGNIFYSLDWDLYFSNLEVYGEFLLDDLQIEQKSKIDLEPNEWGIIAGLQWSDPFGWSGSICNAEYVQIRHRVYNSPNYDWEKYLHRNRVIGYALESNMDRYYLRLDKWWNGSLRSGMLTGFSRRGEGSIAGEFNKDYLDTPDGQTYSEPFPFGVVEKHLQVGVSLFYRPIQYGHIQLDMAYNNFNNYLNMDGRSEQEWSGRIELWLDWNGVFKLD